MPGPAIDASTLPRTSEKRQIPWRENRISFLLVRASGQMEQSHLLADKRRLATACGPDDRLLAIRRMRFHSEVLWVDDLAQARLALAPS
jgi:hypothetical protein